jgi:hypothetical protein
MDSTLTKESIKELTEILQKQFSGLSDGFPDDLVEDLGSTLLNLTAISLKRRLKKKKHKNSL